MAKESTFKNMVIVLGLICLICSALLAVVYSVTEDPIADALIAKTNDAISQVLPEYDNMPGEESSLVEVNGQKYVVYTARKGESITGYAVESKAAGFGGELKLMVGFDAATGDIYNVYVISHSETPGLGAKISDNSPGNFKEQFKGFNPAEKVLKVHQEGGDVDAITASTITSKAFTSAVSSAYDVYRQLKGDSADGVTSATQTNIGGGNDE
ncbi:MAG: RnfABCDGE type electron transport complex subunit G [Bacteroidales bacterium]|nr:RnfABCDGE type electron transport complex subunit G [Bacteroidales bacterium]